MVEFEGLSQDKNFNARIELDRTLLVALGQQWVPNAERPQKTGREAYREAVARIVWTPITLELDTVTSMRIV